MSGKLLIALVISAFLHLILIANITFTRSNFFKFDTNTKLVSPSSNVPELQVGFLVLTKPGQASLKQKLELSSLEKSKDEKYVQYQNGQKKTQLEPEKENLGLPLKEVAKNASSESSEFSSKQYYKSNEVDISAIPVRGIDPPVTTTTNTLLEVYQLRVFINKNGTVDKVVNLDEKNAPQLFYAEVESQIKNLTFIPAKKDGVEVDSYIDIALGK